MFLFLETSFVCYNFFDLVNFYMTEIIKEPVEGVELEEIVREQAIQVHLEYESHSYRSLMPMQIRIHLH